MVFLVCTDNVARGIPYVPGGLGFVFTISGICRLEKAEAPVIISKSYNRQTEISGVIPSLRY